MDPVPAVPTPLPIRPSTSGPPRRQTSRPSTDQQRPPSWLRSPRTLNSAPQSPSSLNLSSRTWGARPTSRPGADCTASPGLGAPTEDLELRRPCPSRPRLQSSSPGHAGDPTQAPPHPIPPCCRRGPGPPCSPGSCFWRGGRGQRGPHRCPCGPAHPRGPPGGTGLQDGPRSAARHMHHRKQRPGHRSAHQRDPHGNKHMVTSSQLASASGHCGVPPYLPTAHKSHQ